jgi:hypothetical protein
MSYPVICIFVAFFLFSLLSCLCLSVCLNIAISYLSLVLPSGANEAIFFGLLPPLLILERSTMCPFLSAFFCPISTTTKNVNYLIWMIGFTVIYLKISSWIMETISIETFELLKKNCIFCRFEPLVIDFPGYRQSRKDGHLFTPLFCNFL